MGKMADSRKQYLSEYKRTVLKRVPLEVRREFYSTIQERAEAAGESVTGYIKKAVQMRIDAEAVQPETVQEAVNETPEWVKRLPKIDPSNRNSFGI